MPTINNKTNRLVGILLASPTILIIACILIITGYVLMSGPGSTEQAFIPDIFSTRRIVVAPMVCLAGYLLVVVAILRRR